MNWAFFEQRCGYQRSKRPVYFLKNQWVSIYILTYGCTNDQALSMWLALELTDICHLHADSYT